MSCCNSQFQGTMQNNVDVKHQLQDINIINLLLKSTIIFIELFWTGVHQLNIWCKTCRYFDDTDDLRNIQKMSFWKCKKYQSSVESAKIFWARLYAICFTILCITPSNCRLIPEILKKVKMVKLSLKPVPSVSWIISKFCGMYENWLSMVISNVNLTMHHATEF